jgi:hypothetical protein
MSSSDTVLQRPDSAPHALFGNGASPQHPDSATRMTGPTMRPAALASTHYGGRHWGGREPVCPDEFQRARDYLKDESPPQSLSPLSRPRPASGSRPKSVFANAKHFIAQESSPMRRHNAQLGCPRRQDSAGAFSLSSGSALSAMASGFDVSQSKFAGHDLLQRSILFSSHSEPVLGKSSPPHVFNTNRMKSRCRVPMSSFYLVTDLHEAENSAAACYGGARRTSNSIGNRRTSMGRRNSGLMGSSGRVSAEAFHSSPP